jgi:hypothetical protein
VVQEYAKKVAEKLWKTEFKASFRTRHQIVFNELCGDSSDVNSETTGEWVAKLQSTIEGYEPENMANSDETAKIIKSEYCNFFLFSVMFACVQ